MRYLKILFIGLFLMTFLISCERKCENIEGCHIFEHDGLTRNYILYLPESLKKNAPLVFVLHGYTGAPQHLQFHSKFNKLADKHGFAVCYPKGTKDKHGNSHWDADLEVSETDDVGFLKNLATHLQTSYEINPNRIFACGMSNGGFMSYTLACQASDVFRATASVTGIMSKETWEKCSNAAPIPILQIHGIADKVVLIDGTMSEDDGWGGAPKLDSIMDFWGNKNNCLTKDSTIFTEHTNAYYYRNCLDSNEVWYYKIANYGHSWPKSKDAGWNASEVIWGFFSRY